MVGTKHAFWQALVFTIVIFLIGLVFGAFLETYRADKLQRVLLNSEVSLLDEQLRARAGEFNISCSIEKASLFDFADRIYLEAQTLEKYDSSSKFSDSLKQIHRRYDLLRFVLWTESIDFEKRCGSDFHTIVYFYNYGADDIDVKAQQTFYGNLLTDLKSKYPSEVLLIPIATNLNLSSLDLVLSQNKIISPSIYVNSKTLITGEISSQDLESKVFGNLNKTSY